MSDSQNNRSQFLITAVAFEGGLALVALAVGWVIGFSPLTRLNLSTEATTENVKAMGIGLAAVVPMIIGMLLLDYLPLQSLRHLNRLVNRLVLPLFKEASLIDLAVVSLMAGVGEEVLFRGLIQDGLQNWFDAPWGPLAAVVLTSVAFGLAHSITRTYCLLATLAGAFLGVLYLWTDNLLAPVVTHAVYDFLALVYFTRMARTECPDET